MTPTNEESLVIVDDQDTIIGAAPRAEAHTSGLTHRISHVILSDGANDLLIQKRSAEREFNANKWTSSASGHVQEGSTYEETAEKELLEELGTTAAILAVAKTRSQSTSERGTCLAFVTLFTGRVSHGSVKNACPVEIDRIEWFPKERLYAAASGALTLTDDSGETVELSDVLQHLLLLYRNWEVGNGQ